MTERHPVSRIAAVLLAVGLLISSLSVRAEEPPVVVELFTSQGCSSCPPADRLLGELRTRDDVIALSFHVDYWDYIGWEDPFAKARYTERQREYVRVMGGRYVYTPQMVFDGHLEAVGSRRAEVQARIARAKADGKAVRPQLVADAGGSRIVVPEGKAETSAAVWLVLYDGRHETPVARGENAGSRLANYNVVRRLERIGTWTGSRLEIPVNLEAARAEGHAGCAVLVQENDGNGPIVGAAAMTFGSSG